MVKPIYEFLVWDNCNNNCKFCFQRKCPRLFTLDEQKDILQKVLEYLDSSEYVIGSHVLIVGGELFDDRRRFQFLHSFFDEIMSRMLSNRIDILYLNTNLIYSKNELQEVISILQRFSEKKILNRIHFTTSYDLYGRYRNEESRRLFIDNLRQLSQIDHLNVVVNMIMTKGFCNDIVAQDFNLFDFSKMNKVSINLIPYIVLDDTLTPSRNEIFKAIREIYFQNRQFVIQLMHELDLKQPRKMLYYKNGNFKRCECKMSSCGHSVNFKRYSKNDTCFVCDMKKIFSCLD